MQFRLCNAAAPFQWLRDQIIRDLPFVFVFVDDILVVSRTLEEHLEKLKTLFELSQECGFSLKHLKCILEVSSIEFLGYRVSLFGIEPLPVRVDCILKLPKTFSWVI